MDAIKFIEGIRKLCGKYSHCSECPACGRDLTCIFSCKYGAAPFKQIEFLQKWLEKHPCKTRQSVFLNQYPEAEIINDVLNICPMLIDKPHRDDDGVCTVRGESCYDCMSDFWKQEL